MLRVVMSHPFFNILPALAHRVGNAVIPPTARASGLRIPFTWPVSLWTRAQLLSPVGSDPFPPKAGSCSPSHGCASLWHGAYFFSTN
jgi:hypothetical protein